MNKHEDGCCGAGGAIDVELLDLAGALGDALRLADAAARQLAVAGPAPDQLLAVRRRRPGHAPHRGPPGRSRETPPALAQASLSADVARASFPARRRAPGRAADRGRVLRGTALAQL